MELYDNIIQFTIIVYTIILRKIQIKIIMFLNFCRKICIQLFFTTYSVFQSMSKRRWKTIQQVNIALDYHYYVVNHYSIDDSTI